LLFTLTKAALALYACWLQWSLADALAATAGGTTGSRGKWNLIQFKVALLALVVIALGALSLGLDWLSMQILTRTRFGI
jgi:hypothetical protein